MCVVGTHDLLLLMLFLLSWLLLRIFLLLLLSMVVGHGVGEESFLIRDTKFEIYLWTGLMVCVCVRMGVIPWLLKL